MKRRHLLAAVFLGFLLLLAAVAVRNALAVNAAQTRLTQLTQETGTINSKIAAIRAASRLSQPKVDPKDSPSVHGTTPTANGFNPDISERLEKEPLFQSLFLAKQRASINERYGAFFQKLHLSSDRREAFLRIADDHDEQELDLNAVMKSEGLTMQDSAISSARVQIEQNFEHSIHTLLGEEEYREFQEYQRTTSLRGFMNGIVGGSVTVLHEPFTAQQTEQLIQAMAESSPSYRAGSFVTSSTIDWPQADAQAQRILTPTQFEYFRTLEPPGEYGGRFQQELYRVAILASAAETQEKKP
jgi:hypothetical protein